MQQPQGSGHSAPSVLVVDDDELQRVEIMRCIEDLGIPTHEASNGKEAMDVAREFLPAVIIMDIRMPVVDGIEATRNLAATEGYNPKIVLITGDPASLFEANRMKLNIHSVIEKPISLRSLARFVISAMA